MYRKSATGWKKHLDFMILDVFSIQIAFMLAYIARYGLENPCGHELYRTMAIVLAVIDMGVLIFFGSMKNVLKRDYYRELSMTVSHVLLVILIATFYLFYRKSGKDYSRLAMLYLGLLYMGISYAVRLWRKNWLKNHMSLGTKRSLLIITTEAMLDTVISNLLHHNYEMFRIAGVAVLDRDLTGHICDGIPVVANGSNVITYVCREWVDEVFVNLAEEVPYPEKLLNQLTEMGVVVHMNMVKTSSLPGKQKMVGRLGIYTVLTTSINDASDWQLFLKRAMDIAGGIAGCLITAVLFVILAPLIYIQSPGPVFFSQIRVGKNGKKFKIYKFRSMYLDAEEKKEELMKENRVSDGMMFKLDYDPRIIGCKKQEDGTIKKGIGNIIREWSLDEFPQFFNVLKGDMSMVGTRPPTVDEWKKYDLHHRIRLATKPGITGMWQVSGRSNITDFEEVVKLDKKYISEWSMGLDIKILLKTVLVVLRHDGAM